MRRSLVCFLILTAVVCAGCRRSDREKVRHDVQRADQEVRKDLEDARHEVHDAIKQADKDVRKAAEDARREVRDAVRDARREAHRDDR